MQSDLLASKWGDRETINTVKENIGLIFDGTHSHRADPLKVGLRKAFDMKKHVKQRRDADLRYSNTSYLHDPYRRYPTADDL